MPSTPSPPVSAPFTPTNSIDSASFASIFATLSNNFDVTTGTGPSFPPGVASAFSSFISASEAASASRQLASSSQTASPSATATGSLTTSTIPAPASSGTLQTATAPSDGSGSSASSSAAANTAGLHKDSSSGLSSGVQAAIAVPIVVAALVIIGLIYLCVRRRKKPHPDDTLEKAPVTKGKKKWSRHLRIFSFDTELLMGGRFSSTNSVQSRHTGSVRSADSRSGRGDTPSLSSIDEVAPPYRDAISAARPPSSVARAMTGAAAADPGRRPSTRSAPPPYGPGHSHDRTSPTTPTSTTHSNPFADDHLVSPFNDPPGASGVGRNRSVHDSRDDVSTISGISDAASIHHATLGRSASVMSGGRVINNVSHS